MATPNDWELIFGDQPSEQAQMLSNLLRRRQAMGDIVGLVGGKPLQPMAQSLGRSADEGLNRLREAAATRAQNQLGTERNQLGTAQLAEKARATDMANRLGWAKLNAINENMRGGPVVVGEGGRIYRVDPQGNRATPVVGPGGESISKPMRGAIPGPEVTAVDTAKQAFNNIDQLKSSFKDTYAGKGFTGDWQRDIAAAAGTSGTKGMQDFAQWWANFDKLANLPERLKIFGATLTKYELQSWRAAQYVNPKNDPKRIREQLDLMEGIWRASLQRRANRLVESGYSPQEVKALFGPDFVQGGKSQSKGAQVHDPGARVKQLLLEGLDEDQIIQRMVDEGYGE